MQYRVVTITAAILSIAVLDGIVSGQTAPWTGLFTIAALLGMAAFRLISSGSNLSALQSQTEQWCLLHRSRSLQS